MKIYTLLLEPNTMKIENIFLTLKIYILYTIIWNIYKSFFKYIWSIMLNATPDNITDFTWGSHCIVFQNYIKTVNCIKIHNFHIVECVEMHKQFGLPVTDINISPTFVVLKYELSTLF